MGTQERDDDGWRRWEIVASGDILKELLTEFALDWNRYEGKRALKDAESGRSDLKDRVVTWYRGDV